MHLTQVLGNTCQERNIAKSRSQVNDNAPWKFCGQVVVTKQRVLLCEEVAGLTSTWAFV